MSKLTEITESLLELVSDFDKSLGGEFTGAYNIREDGECAARHSTENIQIDTKLGLPGLDIHIKPGTKGETVYIPACVTKGGIDDLTYNDFFVGRGADIVIVAGCGVHDMGSSPGPGRSHMLQNS